MHRDRRRKQRHGGVQASVQLIVAADHFDLHAKLGFLLGAFSKTIEAEITKNLDDLLSKGSKAAPAKASPAKVTRKKGG